MSRRFKQEVFPDEEISFPPDLRMVTVWREGELTKVVFSRALSDEELQAFTDGLKSVFNG